MKRFLGFVECFILSLFVNFHVFAQIELVNTNALDDLSILSTTYEGNQSYLSEANAEMNLGDFFVLEAENEVEFADFDRVMLDVVGYREMPSHTMDEFDLEPVVYDFAGEVGYDMEMDGIEVDIEESEKMLSHEYFDIQLLERRALHTIIAPPCGSPSLEIFCEDVDIPMNTCLFDFPIKNHDPYLLQLQADKSIHLLSDAPFGVEMGDLELSGKEENIKGRRYKDLSIEFDAFQLEPVCVKVYDKWGELVETHKAHTDEKVWLKTSDYWWGLYWVEIHFENDKSLLLKQLYLDK